MSPMLTWLLIGGVAAFVGSGLLIWRDMERPKRANTALRGGGKAIREYCESLGTLDWPK